MVIPSSCGMFVYSLVTSIETKIAFSTTLVFSMKLIKSVVSLRYDFCDLAIGWRRLSTNDKILSVGPFAARYDRSSNWCWFVNFCESVESGAPNENFRKISVRKTI